VRELGPESARGLLVPLLERWIDEGAEGVALVGSYARGEAGDESDVDVAIVGEGPHSRLEILDGVLVSASWAPADEQRARLYEPHYLATHVAGWRTAVILHDPEGLATSIAAEAREWSWNLVADHCDAWAAETVTSFAEEALKVAAALASSWHTLAAAERAILVVRLALPVALRRRVLLASENELWDRIGAEVGDEWREAQSAALALNGEDVEASARGALRLFELAVREVQELLDERQRAVVELALRAVAPFRESS
jgi:predicted nucleotidyltransferase